MDDPNAAARAYPSSETRQEGDSVVHAETGVCLKARWVPPQNVRWTDDGVPMHPSIEGLVLVSERRIGVLNDNNFPFSVGRHAGTGLPDDNEFIVIDLGQPLFH